jgi:hypothetical protein
MLRSRYRELDDKRTLEHLRDWAVASNRRYLREDASDVSRRVDAVLRHYLKLSSLGASEREARSELGEHEWVLDLAISRAEGLAAGHERPEVGTRWRSVHHPHDHDIEVTGVLYGHVRFRCLFADGPYGHCPLWEFASRYQPAP